ncbi:phage/plasmid primase, P4 family [uncultured Limosilactobacillus sp.]|uniref:DNA primase family protein n=1 Tax=uncultured Limosilactobacillus sp. TaxID=2837629 RepID=UPI0025EA3B75|nr:phage/plasmid primase, P4 family [uncultured Limosilactobacillus sp.]
MKKVQKMMKANTVSKDTKQDVRSGTTNQEQTPPEIRLVSDLKRPAYGSTTATNVPYKDYKKYGRYPTSKHPIMIKDGASYNQLLTWFASEPEEKVPFDRTSLDDDTHKKAVKALEKFAEDIESVRMKYRPDLAKKDACGTLTMIVDGSKQSWVYNPLDHPRRPFTEDGIAMVLSDMLRGHAFYDMTNGTWMIWKGSKTEGSRWIDGGKNAPDIRALATPLSVVMKRILIYNHFDREHTYFKSDHVKAECMKMISAIPKKITMDHMIDLCKSSSNLGRSNIQYDTWNSFNVKNGEIDLKNFKLGPADPEHYFTKVAPVAYNPGAKAPLWLSFLDEAMQHDKKMISYLQLVFQGILHPKALGEHVFVLISRLGSTGKTTTIQTLATLLGSKSPDGSGFATSVNVKLFQHGGFKADGPNESLADMSGARMVYTTEPDDDFILDEGSLKSLLSDDIKTRRIYKEQMRIANVATIMIATNHFPAGSGDDSMTRRIQLIPYDHKIGQSSLLYDPDLIEKLRKPEEQEGILAWLVEGAKRYQAIKQKQARVSAKLLMQWKANKLDHLPKVNHDPLYPLPRPVAVKSLQYKFKANTAAQFFADRLRSKVEFFNFIAPGIGNNTKITKLEAYWPMLVADENISTPAAQVYKLYRAWCEAQGVPLKDTMSQVKFGETAKSIVTSQRTNRGVQYLGIGLTPFEAVDELYQVATVHRHDTTYQPGPYGRRIATFSIPNAAVKYTKVGENYVALVSNNVNPKTDKHMIKKIDISKVKDTDKVPQGMHVAKIAAGHSATLASNSEICERFFKYSDLIQGTTDTQIAKIHEALKKDHTMYFGKFNDDTPVTDFDFDQSGKIQETIDEINKKIKE